MKPETFYARPGRSLVSWVSSTLLNLVCVVVFCVPIATSLQAAEEKIPLTKAEIPVAPNEMPDYILEQLKKDPFVKENFGWKLAFCQHPMYLLIDEDRGQPTVGERVPPWGAANAKDYVQRVSRNLQSLENLPELKLNYQWSAVAA
jgi:hypothetical protein